MKKTIIIPDKEIQLKPYGDKVKIYVNKNTIDFEFCCDGTGNSFTLTKEEIRKWLGEKQ